MVTTLGSSLGVTADVSTATNLSSSMSAWRSGSSGGTHHHGDKKHKDGNVTVGLILPLTRFGVREYIRSVKEAVEKLTKSRGPKLHFLKKLEFSPKQVHSVMMTLTPSPTGKYTIHCILTGEYFVAVRHQWRFCKITEIIVIGPMSS